MKVPCEECITLAICRNKKQVMCEQLFSWLQTNRYDLTRSKVKTLGKCFPNIKLFGLSTFIDNEVTFYRKGPNDGTS